MRRPNRMVLRVNRVAPVKREFRYNKLNFPSAFNPSIAHQSANMRRSGTSAIHAHAEPVIDHFSNRIAAFTTGEITVLEIQLLEL